MIMCGAIGEKKRLKQQMEPRARYCERQGYAGVWMREDEGHVPGVCNHVEAVLYQVEITHEHVLFLLHT